MREVQKMCYQKTIQSKTLLKRFLKISEMFILSVMTIILFLVQTTQAHKNSNDCFYIADLNNTIEIDDPGGDIKWQNANRFTFGTEGHTEVKVYGKYKLNAQLEIDSLFLAFQIKEDAKPHKYDVLSICFDPNNLGEPSDTNALVQYNVFPIPDLLTKYYICRSMDEDGNYNWNYNLNPSPDFIKTVVDWDSSANTWEAEIFINCKDTLLTGVETDSFGLYFQVLDFINDSCFVRYFWPTSASTDTANRFFIPPASQWANGHFVTPTSNTLPDFYLSHWDMKINNSNTNFKIFLDRDNSFSSKIRHIFFGGDLNGVGEKGTLEFKIAEFGASCFDENYQSEVDVIPLDGPIDGDATREGAGDGLLTITLRSDFSCAGDAITSNNISLLNMKYEPAIEGKTFKTPVTISNCSASESIAFEYNRATTTTNSQYQLASPSISQENSPEIFYIFLDRSMLDTRKAKSDWEIKFTPVDNEDTPIQVPDSVDKDLYRLVLEPDSSATFQMQITTPTYQFAWDKLPLFDLFKCQQSVRVNKVGSTSKLKTTTSSSKFQNFLSWISLILDKKHPLGRLSRLQLRVYKEQQSFVEGKKVYYLMKTIGYFGSYIDVTPVISIWWKIILGLIIISLIASISYLIKCWRTRKWYFGRYTFIFIIIFLLIVVLYLIRLFLIII